MRIIRKGKKEKGKKGKAKKAQLLGTEVLLWVYRFFLIGLLAIGTIIIVSRYQSIELDKNPIMASQILNSLLECKQKVEDCLNVDENVYTNYEKSIGNSELAIYCDLKKQKIKLKVELYCKDYNVFKDGKLKSFSIAIKQ